MIFSLLYLGLGSLFYAGLIKSAMPIAVPVTAEIIVLPFVTDVQQVA